MCTVVLARSNFTRYNGYTDAHRKLVTCTSVYDNIRILLLFVLTVAIGGGSGGARWAVAPPNNFAVTKLILMLYSGRPPAFRNLYIYGDLLAL